ncbi:hypothetical protein AVL48_33570 [Amycolatopsis regifaucium]|uniref:Uncharacterized protein n=1 Tax=Amycolatopsis regifaucium TaxID=546365 RepID=A0A154MK87_9PSEU|nr:hypothetical protein AVL48_33570 [Amycolatopsis regifaucium]SFJ69471.1 hypothetical protein SAMN04489731_13115 [Amycolatopsis regifaucium]
MDGYEHVSAGSEKPGRAGGLDGDETVRRVGADAVFGGFECRTLGGEGFARRGIGHRHRLGRVRQDSHLPQFGEA